MRTTAGLQLWGSHSEGKEIETQRQPYTAASHQSCSQPGLAAIDGQVMGSVLSDIKPCHVVGALPPLARFDHRVFLWVFHQPLNPRDSSMAAVTQLRGFFCCVFL